MTIEERFWAKVDKPVDPNGCWVWMSSKRGKGYGSFRLGKHPNGTRHVESSHRLAWIFVRGPIPYGMCVLHKCDNPPCCNPDHLFLGSVAENNRDRNRKGRSARLLGDDNPSRQKPERLLRGLEHPRPCAKITPEIVTDIRSRYSSGETQLSIARIYSIHQVHVSRIIRGVRWGHVQ